MLEPTKKHHTKKGIQIIKDGHEVTLSRNMMKAIELIIKEAEKDKEWYSSEEVFGEDWLDPAKAAARNLAGLRFREGLTQNQLSKKLGIHQSNLSAMESGERKIPKKYHKKLAKILNCDSSEFDLEALKQIEQKLKQEN